jgi:hypothetical protein
MTKNKEELDYDVRIVDRNIREGAVSKKDYDKYVKGLPDVEEKGEPLVFEDEIEEEVSLDQEPEAAQEESETEEEEKEEETQ